jgi:hypothetical protein
MNITSHIGEDFAYIYIDGEVVAEALMRNNRISYVELTDEGWMGDYAKPSLSLQGWVANQYSNFTK